MGSNDAASLSQLQDRLEQRLPLLRGYWIQKNSGYDESICRILGFKHVPSERGVDRYKRAGRYWDATWNGYRLEFKKGDRRWLDAVRYSEIVLGYADPASMHTLILFFFPSRDKARIIELMCLETRALIQFWGLTPAIARTVIDVDRHFKQRMNGQVSFTLGDLRRLKLFSVSTNR